MAVNVASKYATKVDERFRLKNLTQLAVNNEYSWDGVKTVTVYGVSTVAMADYTRTGLTRYGTAAELDNTVQNLTLAKDRSFTFTIDKGNFGETQGVMEAGKALSRQIEEIVVPEIDIYRLNALSLAATAAGGTTGAAVDISASNAYAKFLAATEYLNTNKIPLANRVAFITPTYYTFLKQDTTFVLASEAGMDIKINGVVGTIDGVKVVVVPTTYMPTKVKLILTHPSACVSPMKLEDYKIHDNPPGISGKLIEGRVIYDAFVLNNKNKAICTHTNLN